MSFRDLAGAAHALCVRTFGDVDDDGNSTIVYHPASGEPYGLQGIFDDQHEQSDPASRVHIASVNPTLGVQLSDMQAPPKEGDRVSVRGVMYKVRLPRPDGVAGVVLELLEERSR